MVQVTTMLVTLLVGPLLDRSGHRLLLVAGFLIVAAAIGLFAAALPAIPAAVASYPRISSGFEFAVALAGLLLFCYIGLEVSAASWTTTHLKHAGFDEKRAALVFSLFWVAMMVSRLAASQWVSTAIGQAAIQACALASALALLLMTFRTARWVASASVIFLGLVFAPLFPTIAGVTFVRFNPSLYGSVFAIIFSLGLLGSSIVPAAIGAVSEKHSIRAGYRIMVVLALALFFLAFGL